MGIGWGARILFLWESKLFYEFGLFSCEFGKFHEICKIHEILELWETHGFHDCCSGTGYATDRWAVRKFVLCIAYFAYSLLLVLAFSLLSY